MPIVDMSYENGIFFVREVGCIDQHDARLWAETMLQHARSSSFPIVLLIDALEASSITAEARRIFAKAAETPNVKIGVVASNNDRVMQHSRIAALLGTVRKTHETHFFNTLEEAREFANSHKLCRTRMVKHFLA